MKFTKLIAMLAIVTFAVNATAATVSTSQTQKQADKTAQADSAASNANSAADGSTNKAINININNSADAGQTQEQDQTQKQSSSVKADSNTSVSTVDTQAELLRKARQSAEQQTEERINEKLEVSRLKEERERADRLFGTNIDPDRSQQPSQIQTVILAPQQTAPVEKAAPVVAPIEKPAPVEKPAPAKSVEEKAPQVTIEKVEIIQPAPAKEPVLAAPVVSPIVEKQEEKKEEAKEVKDARFYVGGTIGGMKYNADNITTSPTVGALIGVILQDRYVIEASYTYSRSNVADIWDDQLYHNLDQNDLSLAAKYYLLDGKFRPLIGVSATYINRKYTDLYSDYSGYNTYSDTTTTNAVNMGVLAGIDYMLNDHFAIGIQGDYNFNVYASQDVNYASYYLPNGVKPLEQINYMTFKASIKYMF